MPHRPSPPLHIARDFALIGGLLAAVNWTLSRSDFGWLELNPTPWLLVPLLIGARYGLISGTGSGVLTALAIVLTRATAFQRPAAFEVSDHLYEVVSIVMLGFLAGQWKQLQSNRVAELARSNKMLRDSLSLAEAEIALDAVARQDLQRQLALHNVEIINLDQDLRRVLSSPSGRFVPALLELLHHHGRITSSALYQVKGQHLEQLGSIHPTTTLAARMELAQTPLAAKALDQHAIAAVKEPLSTTQEQPFLVALPWTDGQAEGVLLIQDMPLEALRWENLSRIELMLHWVFSLAKWSRQITDGNLRQSLPQEDFIAMVDKALQVERIHRVPSVVLKAQLTGGQGSTDATERTLLDLLPQSSVATLLKDKNSLVVLLPFGGQPEGDDLARALQKSGVPLRCTYYVTTGAPDVRQFWDNLIAG